MSSNDVVIAGSARTPMGGMMGDLSSVRSPDLGAASIKAAIERSGLQPADIQEVIMGCVLPGGLGQAPARQASRASGIPDSSGCTTVNKMCGSGMQAVIMAHDQIKAGTNSIMIAGGMENMSQAPYLLPKARAGMRMGHGQVMDSMFLDGLEDAYEGSLMGVFAQRTADKYDISREAADAFAVRSHQNAARAWAEGRFDEQLVPVEIPQRRGDPVVFARDEGFREDASMDTLGKLRAIDGKRDADAIVTAGNASQQNDAAAACLVVAEDKVEELGLEPILWFHSWSAAGCDPSRMGIGPVPAVERLFAKTNMGWDDIGLIELNEAFAPQALAVLKGWGFTEDDSRRELVNVNGSGISLGHPIGATGIRILADMAHEMQRREVRYGLETMCIGGGQG
ncbi:thiolase family protein, partial [uncultured Marinobacter sp.]|uniref:thiolase family protein n=1 Tax=uncultured Marinobacter sp. TaxID=187379 RepID=UPI0025930330